MRILQIAVVVFICMGFIACQQKKESTNEKKPGFPILPFIRSQVTHVDTSLYSIIRLSYTDTSHIDTQYIRREDFGTLASEFINLPDITQEEFADRFKEEVSYDENMQRAIIVSTPVDAAKEVIQRQQLTVIPDMTGAGGESKIKTIYIDYLSNTKDSSVQKRMLWQADKSFQVTTIKQLPGQPEMILTTKTIWNESQDQ